MDTPILDFVRAYQASGTARLHMPGHKGVGPLGIEGWDLTEIKGADSLYEADGIIARSEANAAELFGSRRTFYSAGGSSQCVKAMLSLALTHRSPGMSKRVLAARNVHKSFVHAAALLDLEVEWLWPRGEASLCACPVTAEQLEEALCAMAEPPMAVYITSPDYLGNLQDVGALARAAHRHGTILLVDNAHGAYLHFLDEPRHPLDLGADLCCDSAHKTLPVLTGGAYLHVGKAAPEGLEKDARQALALFGSTSPSYLILASLDACNGWLAGTGREELALAAGRLGKLKADLTGWGWKLAGEEPMKLTVRASGRGWDGRVLADHLRKYGVECEYADPDHLVLMVSAHTTGDDLAAVERGLNGAAEQKNPFRRDEMRNLSTLCFEEAGLRRPISIRQAVFSPAETVPVEEAVGRVCASATVACPPAVPIAVSGEVITSRMAGLFRYYGIDTVDVVI